MLVDKKGYLYKGSLRLIWTCIDVNMLKFFHNTTSTPSTLYEQTFHAMLYKVFFFSADQYLMPGHH